MNNDPKNQKAAPKTGNATPSQANLKAGGQATPSVLGDKSPQASQAPGTPL